MPSSLKRSMTKSPLALARTALEAARRALPAYSSVYSRRDFTQPQLFTLIVLRQFLKTDYRGLIQMLADWSDLRKLLAITKFPHYSTLCYAEKRMLKKTPLTTC